LRKLGVKLPVALWGFGLVGAFDRFLILGPLTLVGLVSVDSLLLDPPVVNALPGAAPADNGLGGILAVLIFPRGGCGKAFILIVFLIDLPAALIPGEACSLGRVELGPGLEGGRRLDDDGVRNPLFGRLGASSLSAVGVSMPPVLFRVFGIGRAGNAEVGGPYEGLEGRGSAAAMIVDFEC